MTVPPNSLGSAKWESLPSPFRYLQVSRRHATTTPAMPGSCPRAATFIDRPLPQAPQIGHQSHRRGIEPVGCFGAFDYRLQASGQLLAELHTPLVERIDV